MKKLLIITLLAPLGFAFFSYAATSPSKEIHYISVSLKKASRKHKELDPEVKIRRWNKEL